jgi:hypothetical protein
MKWICNLKFILFILFYFRLGDDDIYACCCCRNDRNVVHDESIKFQLMIKDDYDDQEPIFEDLPKGSLENLSQK